MMIYGAMINPIHNGYIIHAASRLRSLNGSEQ